MPSKRPTFEHGKRLSDYQLEVLEALESIYDATGKKEIRGTEILKQMGIEYSCTGSSANEIFNCANAVVSLMRTSVISGSRRIGWVKEQSLINCVVDFLTYKTDEGGERYDFIVGLALSDRSNMSNAFPFYKRAREIEIEPTEVNNG